MIRAVLWDADGVLQHNPQNGWGWLAEHGGAAFAEDVFRSELPALRGEQSLRAAMAAVLDRWPRVTLTLPELIGLWELSVPDLQARALVADVRASGVACYLATNQQDHRRAWMRDVLGTDELFDEVFYSNELAAMKPDPEFFRIIVDRIGLPAHEVAFVDDNADNIATAQALGILAAQHDPANGPAGLRSLVESLMLRV